ncbi:MAG: DUF29 domain-containing protein [Caldilineaceae bacterium]|jgi:hypothetical protein
MSATLYDLDFYQWTQSQSDLLRVEGWEQLDWQHIAEEIESLGKKDKRQVQSRLAVLITHLLKWEYQPEKRSPSWRKTLKEQRFRLMLILNDSPSLKVGLPEFIAVVYPYAVENAADETGLDRRLFPVVCSYRIEQVLDPVFLPGER